MTRTAVGRRPWLVRIVATAGAVGVLGSAALYLTTRPPRRAPEYDGPAPARRADGYVTHTEVRHARVPVDRYLRWSESAPLDDILSGDPNVPAVESTTVLRGTWNQVGARRRVKLVDGHYAAEEVVANEHLDGGGSRFHYEVFGYTNYAKLVINHAEGQFLITPVGANETRIEWRYGFRPQTPIVRAGVTRFMATVWAPYMATVLQGMVERAERDA